MKMKIAKRIYNISTVVCVVAGLLGWFLVIAAPSGIDNNTLSWTGLYVLELIGFANILISGVAYKISENYKNYINKRRVRK